MSFRLVPKSVTLDDLERRNGRYILHSVILLNLVTCVPTHNRVDLWRNLCTSLLYLVVRLRCRRKESSRSLSHFLMSFLFYLEAQYNSLCQPTVVIISTVSSVQNFRSRSTWSAVSKTLDITVMNDYTYKLQLRSKLSKVQCRH